MRIEEKFKIREEQDIIMNQLRAENAALAAQLGLLPLPPQQQQQRQFGTPANDTPAQFEFTFSFPAASDETSMQTPNSDTTMNSSQDLPVFTSHPIKTVCSKCHDIDCKPGSECGAETRVD